MQVRPGITGYAQVNGRNAISWKKSLNSTHGMLKISPFGLTLKSC